MKRIFQHGFIQNKQVSCQEFRSVLSSMFDGQRQADAFYTDIQKKISHTDRFFL